MKYQEEQSQKEARRKEKIISEEAERLAKEKVRKKAYFAKEKEIEAVQKEEEMKRAEKRAKDEVEQLAKDKARKEAYFAREKDIAEAQQKRKLMAEEPEQSRTHRTEMHDDNL
jgi:fused signal recognition particle receptor